MDSHCANESVGKEYQAGTEIQDREKCEAREKETELKRRGYKRGQEEVVKWRGPRRNKTR